LLQKIRNNILLLLRLLIVLNTFKVISSFRRHIKIIQLLQILIITFTEYGLNNEFIQVVEKPAASTLLPRDVNINYQPYEWFFELSVNELEDWFGQEELELLERVNFNHIQIFNFALNFI